jgi:hypothetical protein
LKPLFLFKSLFDWTIIIQSIPEKLREKQAKQQEEPVNSTHQTVLTRWTGTTPTQGTANGLGSTG